jgi:tryptophanyl-tRNA synthetase
LEAKFGPNRERYDALLSNRNELDDILAAGAVKARAIAAPVLERVRRAIGIGR